MPNLSLCPNITTMLTNEIVETRRKSEPDNRNELTEGDFFPEKFSYFDILPVNTLRVFFTRKQHRLILNHRQLLLEILHLRRGQNFNRR